MASSRGAVAEPDQYQWEKLPDMPTARCYSVGAYHEGKLYCIGGCDPKGIAMDVAEVYDFATKQWSALPPLPRKRAAASAAIVRNNRIIVVGGVNNKQVPIAEIDCFNTETQSWDPFPPLPIGVVGPHVELINDLLYVIGGTDKKDCNQSVVFDFDRNEWLPLPPKPTPTYSCGGYLFQKKLYIVGGRAGQTPVPAVESFDLETKQWEKHASIPSIRVFYSVVGLGPNIYVLGGLVPMVGIAKIAERYSIHEDQWTRIKDLTEIRSDSISGVIGGRIVLAGGLGGENLRAMDTVESLSPKGKRFVKLPQLSKARSSMSRVIFDGKLVAMNGVGDGGAQTLVEILSVKEEARKDKDA